MVTKKTTYPDKVWVKIFEDGDYWAVISEPSKTPKVLWQCYYKNRKSSIQTWWDVLRFIVKRITAMDACTGFFFILIIILAWLIKT